MGCAKSQPAVTTAPAPAHGPADALADAGSPNSLHDEYALHGRLGHGSFGCVIAASPRSPEAAGDEVAVKVVSLATDPGEGKRAAEEMLHSDDVRMDDWRRKALDSEVEILRSLPASPHLVSFLGFFSEGPLAYLVFERCKWGLRAFLLELDTLTEETMKVVLGQMLTGLAACHNAGVVHRDVKPDNFLADDAGGGAFVVKLCDFGLAASIGGAADAELSGIIGTTPFMAPELVAKERYGTKVDVWSLGVTAYLLLFGCLPYTLPGKYSSAEMRALIRCGTPAPPFRPAIPELPTISPVCRTWLRGLLRRIPEERTSAARAMEATTFLAHWGVERPAPSLRPAVVAAVGAFEHRAPSARAAAIEREAQMLNARRVGAKISVHASEASTSVDGSIARLQTPSSRGGSAGPSPRRGRVFSFDEGGSSAVLSI